MKRTSIAMAAMLVCGLCGAVFATVKPPIKLPYRPSYPPTKVEPVTDDYFGTKITDDYRWLENGEDPAVKAWTESQNAFTRKYLDAVPQRAAIIKELTALWNYEKMGVPSHYGPYYFFTKNDGLQNQSPLFVQEGLAGKARVLIDPNTLSSDGTVALDWYYVSEHGKYIAYGTSPGGTEQSTLRVRESSTGKDLPDAIPGCRFSSIAWLKDESGFYYSRFPKPGTVGENEINYNQRIMFHKLGADPDNDALVFSVPGKKETTFGVDLSNDGRYLLIQMSEGSDRRTEILVKDIASGAMMYIAKGVHNAYSGEIVDGTFYCLADEGAPKGCVYAISMKEPQRDKWKLIIPEGEDTIESASIVNREIMLQVMHNACSAVRFYDLDGTFSAEMPLPPLGTVTGIFGKWDSDEVFAGYTSFTRPSSVYRYDFSKNSLSLFFEPKVPFDARSLETEQVWYPSKDGTKVSMFIVHEKGFKRDGKTPCYLTGYGGFDISEQPFFSPVIAWWLRQGFVFAMPNLRGGGEYGEAWHKAGMLDKKQNVFDDFISAAEWLVANKYTSTPKLAIEGGSNGGLLTGACLVQRPDLYGAVIVEVPLLDMLRYQRFSIARYWIPEYGSSEDPEQFKYMLKYSPYQNVKPASYPPTLIMAGANDSRVDPLHARKMTALLQAKTTGSAPILLRVESKAGHGQGKPTAKRIEEAADRYAFLVWSLNLAVDKRDER